ncbi:hypothetical protein JQ543_09805 [Bradyrhizobium diazoefficiens]|nr:hypothetical protein [Bradyrhizobium diazoefficiens]MBR0848033.1 hypothetical protein [Bradyrhizobium diazoefficiens]
MPGKIVPLSQQAASSAAVATERLCSIRAEIEASVSHLEFKRLTPSEMARVLRIFDAANACIRIVLSDFGKDPAINHLIDQSHGIKALIETAREHLACLDAESPRVPQHGSDRRTASGRLDRKLAICRFPAACASNA